MFAEFLWRRPVLAQADGTIYAGNMRYRAAEHRGLETIPAIVEDISDQLARERALPDNAQWGEWQEDELAALLGQLREEAELAEFNDFYTNVHVPEVVAASGFARGMRYELYREFRHPEPGSPQFLAVYDADEASIEALHERRANPRGGGQAPLSSGPPVWEAHDILWRLEYRRID